MNITTQKDGTIVRFLPKGAIASGNGAGSLRREVADALAAGARRIEVDVSGVKYLDAAGLGALVASRRMARDMGAEFRLYGAAGKPLEMLRITGLDRKLLRRTGHEFFPGGHRSVA